MRTATIALVLSSFVAAGPAHAQGKAAAAPGDPQTYRGTYSVKGGSAGFTPCQTKTRLKATDETHESILSAMYAEVARDDPSGSVFAQVTGVKAGQGIRITGIEKMYRVGPGCKEDVSTVIWKARGYEPGWWLEADALTVRFQPMSETAPLNFGYRTFTKKDASLVFEAETEAGKIQVLLLPHRCQDEGAGGIYSWRAEVTFRDERYTGCAYPGDARP